MRADLSPRVQFRDVISSYARIARYRVRLSPRRVRRAVGITIAVGCDLDRKRHIRTTRDDMINRIGIGLSKIFDFHSVMRPRGAARPNRMGKIAPRPPLQFSTYLHNSQKFYSHIFNIMRKCVNGYLRAGTIILTSPLFIATNGIRSIFNPAFLSNSSPRFCRIFDICYDALTLAI